MTLTAVTRPLDGNLRLLDEVNPGDFVFKRNGWGIVATGWAASVTIGDVASDLAAIDRDDAVQRRGSGPLAVGALPFDGRAGRMRIPERIVGVDESGAWETIITGGGEPPAALHNGLVPDQFLSRAEWTEAVQTVLDRIERGSVEKVVLSRRVVIEHETAFDIPGVVRRIAAARPDAWVYADRGFVGATPELLLARHGDRIVSLPMAGTVEAAAARSLLASPKLLHEFEVVVLAIATALEQRCTELSVGPSTPRLAGNVAHLSSEVRGTLADPTDTALDLAIELHPTPAVGGTPNQEALALIDKLEPAGRGPYAGPVGWIDANGDGEFAVALRCARISGRHAVLYSGCGIVAGSDPDEEWAETESKLVAMRDVLS